MIKVLSSNILREVKIIQLNSFMDHRGEYVETYNKELYAQMGIEISFVQDDYSKSKKNVLRGIHGDDETWKLITCPHGELFLVVVNCDKDSDEFGKWESFVLSDKNHLQVLIPPKYGNGHLILSDVAIFQYKQTTYYNPAKQFSYRWDNPRFKINWPCKDPILSERDRNGGFII